MRIIVDLENDSIADLKKIENMIKSSILRRKKQVYTSGTQKKKEKKKKILERKEYLKTFDIERKRWWERIVGHDWQYLPAGEIYSKIKQTNVESDLIVHTWRGDKPMSVNYISRLKHSFFKPEERIKSREDKEVPGIPGKQVTALVEKTEEKLTHDAEEDEEELDEEEEKKRVKEEMLSLALKEECKALDYSAYGNDITKKIKIEDLVYFAIKGKKLLSFEWVSKREKWLNASYVNPSTGEVEITAEQRWHKFLEDNNKFLEINHVYVPPKIMMPFDA